MKLFRVSFLFAVIVGIFLLSTVSLASIVSFNISDDLIAPTTGNYTFYTQNITWISTAPKAYYWNIRDVPQTSVIVPSSSSFNWTLLSRSGTGYITHKPYFINNNTWWDNYTMNTAPTGTAYAGNSFISNVAPGVFVGGFYLNDTTSPVAINKLYKEGWYTGAFLNTSYELSPDIKWYGLNSSYSPLLWLNLTNFYTGYVTIPNPSEHVYFDFESGIYTQCDTTACSFAEADMTWYRPQNRVNDFWGTDGFVQVGSDQNTQNVLNAIACSEYAGFYGGESQYDTVQCVDYPPICLYYIYCFNQSFMHGDNQFYGVVKFLNATDNNLTFYYALYSGSESLELGGFSYSPIPVVSTSDLTAYWHTGVSSDSRLFYRNRFGSGSWSSWENVYNATNVTTHIVVLNKSKIYANYEYQIFAYSEADNATATSDVLSFNVSIGDATTTTTTTVPVGACTSGKIQSVTASDYNPVIDGTVKVDIFVTNNGTGTCSYAVGLSVGNSSSSVYCNRDCYDDCAAGTRGTAACDYVSTGSVAVGHTVKVTRYFKFRNEYFLPSTVYDMTVGLWTAPYSTVSYDYKIYEDIFSTKTIGEKAEGGILAYAVSAVASPLSLRRGSEVKVTGYVYNNGTHSYQFRLGMSIGLWNASGIYTEAQEPLIPPCNTGCYTDGKGDWENVTLPAGYTDPFTRTFRIPDYFIENNKFDAVVGIYIGDGLVSYTYFKNISFVQEGEPIQHENIVEFATSIFGNWLGLSAILIKVLISMITSIAVGAYTGFKANSGQYGMIAFAGMLVVFVIIGWLAVWVAVLLGVIAGFLVSRFVAEHIGGG